MLNDLTSGKGQSTYLSSQGAELADSVPLSVCNIKTGFLITGCRMD